MNASPRSLARPFPYRVAVLAASFFGLVAAVVMFLYATHASAPVSTTIATSAPAASLARQRYEAMKQAQVERRDISTGAPTASIARQRYEAMKQAQVERRDMSTSASAASIARQRYEAMKQAQVER